MKKVVATILAAAMTLAFQQAVQAQPQYQDHQYQDHQNHQDQGRHRHGRKKQVDRNWHGGPSARQWNATSYYQPATRYQPVRYITRNDESYRGGDGRYYCRRNDGTTGLVVGAALGGLLGNSVGGDLVSTLIGVAGGAALGNAIDRGQVSCH
jgi:Ni/Co efflux regulator RcnB